MSDNEQRWPDEGRGSGTVEIETDESRKRRRRRMGPDYADFTKDLLSYFTTTRGTLTFGDEGKKNKLLSAKDVVVFLHVLHTAEYQPSSSLR